MIAGWGVAQRVLSQSILPPPAPDAAQPNSKKLAAIGYKDADVDMTAEDVIPPL